jgi:hypothetical protein
MLRPPRYNAPDDPLQTIAYDREPEAALSDFAEHHMRALARVDTVTLDPHKSGFIPYPAGALCYRDERMPDLISITSPVVSHGGVFESVGTNGIEGSKPGAAAVATHLSHTVIPTNAAGYGRILGRCVFGAKRFYAALVSLHDAQTPYTITPVNLLPAEEAGKSHVEIEEERDRVRRHIVPLKNETLMARFEEDHELEDLFRALGPDLTVVAYAVNFRTAAGINRDLGLMNELNDRLFRRMSLETNDDKHQEQRPLYVTASEYDPAGMGQDFVDALAARAQVTPEPGQSLAYLISTIQNPWVTQTSKGSMLPKLMQELDAVIRQEVHAVVHRHGLTPFDERA